MKVDQGSTNPQTQIDSLILQGLVRTNCQKNQHSVCAYACLLGRGPASPLVHPPPQLNKMGIIRKLRVSSLRY